MFRFRKPKEWIRVSHWEIIFAPQGFTFATFVLKPDASWEYHQALNPDHKPIQHESIEPLMAQAELDWAAHWQVVREADRFMSLYNGR